MQFDKIDPVLERMLDVTAQRQKVLSSNIANIDTPGYKAKDVAFQQELSASLQLVTTHPSHRTVMSTASPAVVEVEGKTNANGNSVDLDHEVAAMTRNGLMYVMLVQSLNSAIKSLRYSISEGTKG